MGLLTGTNAPRYSQYTADQLTGNGSQTTFTLSRTPPTPSSLIVTIDGVKQHSSTYTIGVNQIIFSEAPPNGSSIECISIGSQGVVITPADNTVSTASIINSAVTETKIADNSVGSSKLINGSVTVTKQDVLGTGFGATELPKGTDAQRPSNPLNGYTRNNTTSGNVEFFYNNFWFNLGGMSQVISTYGKTKLAYAYNGTQQYFTVPAGIYYIYAKIWGAGGGGGARGGWNYGGIGGGGGHTRGIISVTPGQTLCIAVGGGGQSVDGVSAWPGGGPRSASGNYGGGGGGYSGIFDSSHTDGLQLMVAGGGGGGGGSRAQSGNIGGGGGGFVAQDGSAPYDGYYNYRGRGATTTSGGIGGGNSGGKWSGGQANAYGGGGGAGIYGGSGGSYVEDDTMGGGGGGAGWIHPTRVSMGESFTASGQQPAIDFDVDLHGVAPMHGVPTAKGGWDAGSNQGGSGGAGLIVIYY